MEPNRALDGQLGGLGLNSLNAFRFIDAGGANHLVRWSMEPTISPTPVPHEALASTGPDFAGAIGQRIRDEGHFDGTCMAGCDRW
jgi:hypothetical protein